MEVNQLIQRNWMYPSAAKAWNTAVGIFISQTCPFHRPLESIGLLKRDEKSWVLQDSLQVRVENERYWLTVLGSLQKSQEPALNWFSKQQWIRYVSKNDKSIVVAAQHHCVKLVQQHYLQIVTVQHQNHESIQSGLNYLKTVELEYNVPVLNCPTSDIACDIDWYTFVPNAGMPTSCRQILISNLFLKIDNVFKFVKLQKMTSSDINDEHNLRLLHL